MIRSHRKEREIRAREEQILESARKVLLEEGFGALSMDRIAHEIEYSRGTVYQHFSSKADVLAALTEQTYTRRTALFERAASFEAAPRDRMLAVGVADDLFVRLYPSHFRAEQIIELTGHGEKVSSERVERIETQEHRCFGICCGIVEEAVARGDLGLPDGVTPELVSFNLWSLSFGAHFLGDTLGRFEYTRFHGTVFEGVVIAVGAMMDGMGWKPLGKDHDWRETARTVRETVFAEEFAALNAGA